MSLPRVPSAASGALLPDAQDALSCEGGSQDGVDVTLIRWMLGLSPRRRLEVLTDNVRAIRRLRHVNQRS